MVENSNRSKHIATRILCTILTVVAAALFVVQIPSIQTKLAEKFLDKFNNRIGGEFSIGEFRVLPFNTIAVSDFLISGGPADTLVYTRSAVLQFSLQSLISDTPRFHKGTVNGGFFNLKSEGDSLNINRIFPKKNKVKTGRDIISFSNLSADGLKVCISGFGESLNYDIQTNLRASNFKIKDNGISCKIEKFNCLDVSGLKVESLKTKLSAGKEGIEIDGLTLSDGLSSLDIPHFLIKFKDRLSMDGRIKDTHISSKSLEQFAAGVEKYFTDLDIKDFKVKGDLSDLTVSKLAFNEPVRGITGELSCRAQNLEDIRNATVNIDISGLSAPFRDHIYSFTGEASGPVNNLQANGKLESGTGTLIADLNVKDLLQDLPSAIEGTIVTANFNIGDILGNKNFGECSIDASGSVSFGKALNSLSVSNLAIDKFDAFGYTYSGIKGNGTYSGNVFDGIIISEDPNLDFRFEGICNLGKNIEDALYKFHLDLRNADFQKLNLDKRGTSRSSFDLQADFNGEADGILLGTIDILDVKLENDAGIHDIGDINISSRTRNGSYQLEFRSNFSDVTYNGSQSFTKIISDIKSVTLGEHIPALLADDISEREGDDFSIDVDFHDSRDLLSFVLPGLYIADSTRIKVDVTNEGKIAGHIGSSRLALKNNYLKDFRLDVDNEEGRLNSRLSSSENKLAGMIIKNSSISAFAHENRIGVSFEYDNETEAENKAEILLSGLIGRDEQDRIEMSVENLASSIYYEGTEWSIEPATYGISKDGIVLDNLSFESGDQSLIIYGGFSSSHADTLIVGMNNFDLAMLSSLIGEKLNVGGLVTGSATFSSPVKENFGLAANLICDNTTMSDLAVGSLSIHSNWDEEAKGVAFDISNELEGIRTIAANGLFSTEDKSLAAGIDLKSFNVGYFKPFIESVFCDVGGGISGTISVKGPPGKLSLSSKDAKIENGFLKIGYTNVLYNLDGPFHLTGDGISFDNISLTDNFRGRGSIRGGFNFNGFSSVETNTNIHFMDTELINLGFDNGDIFYGHIFGTGDLSVKGPLNRIVLDGEATTSQDGNFHLPLGNVAGSASSNLLTFKEEKAQIWEDPYLQMVSAISKHRSGKGSLGVRLRIRVTPEINMFLELDKAGDNVLSGHGSGYVSIETGIKDNPFTINGDYTLQSGNYHLALLGIAKKDFDIRDGSTIKFNGDIMDSDLDIDAAYNTKTSISTLIADTTSIAARRNVECGLRIYDKLRNPQLEFSIDIPDLDPTIKSRVESALNTNDKVQKQFLSLLVTNNFLPDEQSGIVNNSNLLYSNVSEIMSNQLNNILQELEIPLDLGLSYQSSEGGTNIFDVAISTQLFNNRVLVNGNIGNRQYSNNTAQDVIGDLDIEIKLDRTGSFRMNLFSHSADDYTNFLDNLQRNGVGFAYQKEFNNLRQIFSPRQISRSRPMMQQRPDSLRRRPDSLQHHPDSMRIGAPENGGRINRQMKSIIIE